MTRRLRGGAVVFLPRTPLIPHGCLVGRPKKETKTEPVARRKFLAGKENPDREIFLLVSEQV